jgi:hypothetical protein
MREIWTPKFIIEKYGLRYNPKFTCWPNAVVAALQISLLDNNSENLPQIYQYEFFWKRLHAYLPWQGVVLNGGVTAPPGKFNDVSLEELLQQGENITHDLFSTVFAVITDNIADPFGFYAAILEGIPERQFNHALKKIVDFLSD